MNEDEIVANLASWIRIHDPTAERTRGAIRKADQTRGGETTPLP